MLISLYTLATTSKFLRNFCFKIKAVGPIYRETKEKEVVAIYGSGLKRKICTKARSRPKLLQVHATMH